MATTQQLEKEINKIKERNKRVEFDKTWEISKTRKAIITVSTYFIVVLLLWLINAPNPWTNALVPTFAFVLSTLTLPFIKKLWLRYSKK